MSRATKTRAAEKEGSANAFNNNPPSSSHPHRQHPQGDVLRACHLRLPCDAFAGFSDDHRARRFAAAAAQAGQCDHRSRRAPRWRCRAPNHGGRSAWWRRDEPDGCAGRRRRTTRSSRRRGAVGAARSVLLAERRSHRCRRRHRLCNRRYGRGLGRRRSRSRHVLVLHGPIAHAGLLGLLPVTRQRLERVP